jgi:pyridoxal 5-phosphate dependent beta-lyase
VADLAPIWADWRQRRPPTRGIHLNSAAAGRSSTATIAAVADHLRSEAELGAYVAEAAAEGHMRQLRADVAGLLGTSADGVAFVESATAGLRSLLMAWPLPHGSSVAVAPSEWGPNLAAFTDQGFEVVLLGTDDHGRVDLDRLQRQLQSSPPVLVHLTQVAAHRGLVQPVTAIADLCRDAGVPVWVDAAQALGHVDTATGADAVYATGRKWMCGPRGVGVLAITEAAWRLLRVRHHVLAASDEPTVRALESDDANVAGRIGLAVAIREYLALGAAAVHRRLDEVGAEAQAALADLPGWTVAESAGTAITALRPTAGQDPETVRTRLLDEHDILTTASVPARAPHEMTGPSLRISPHVDCSDDQLAALRLALSAIA